jgi:hypothetical protein
MGETTAQYGLHTSTDSSVDGGDAKAETRTEQVMVLNEVVKLKDFGIVQPIGLRRSACPEKLSRH